MANKEPEKKKYTKDDFVNKTAKFKEDRAKFSSGHPDRIGFKPGRLQKLQEQDRQLHASLTSDTGREANRAALSKMQETNPWPNIPSKTTETSPMATIDPIEQSKERRAARATKRGSKAPKMPTSTPASTPQQTPAPSGPKREFTPANTPEVRGMKAAAKKAAASSERSSGYTYDSSSRKDIATRSDTLPTGATEDNPDFRRTKAANPSAKRPRDIETEKPSQTPTPEFHNTGEPRPPIPHNENWSASDIPRVGGLVNPGQKKYGPSLEGWDSARASARKAPQGRAPEVQPQPNRNVNKAEFSGPKAKDTHNYGNAFDKILSGDESVMSTPKAASKQTPNVSKPEPAARPASLADQNAGAKQIGKASAGIIPSGLKSVGQGIASLDKAAGKGIAKLSTAADKRWTSRQQREGLQGSKAEVSARVAHAANRVVKGQDRTYSGPMVGGMYYPSTVNTRIGTPTMNEHVAHAAGRVKETAHYHADNMLESAHARGGTVQPRKPTLAGKLGAVARSEHQISQAKKGNRNLSDQEF